MINIIINNSYNIYLENKSKNSEVDFKNLNFTLKNINNNTNFKVLILIY